MMKYDLPTSDLETLRRQRNVRGKEYIKVTSILMLSRGLSVEIVSDSLGIDISTVYCYWNSYKSLGLDPFLENRHKGYWGMLSSHQLSLPDSYRLIKMSVKLVSRLVDSYLTK